jgi:hypothetical protein
VMMLFNMPLRTSITCNISPASVPKRWAFLMMNNCSFSVVHSIRHVEVKDESVVVLSFPNSPNASIAFMICALFTASFCVRKPLSSPCISLSKLSVTTSWLSTLPLAELPRIRLELILELAICNVLPPGEFPGVW